MERDDVRCASSSFLIKGGRLFYIGPKKTYMRLVVLNEDEKRSALQECHNNPGTGNHNGVRGTRDRVIAGYLWPDLKQDVTEWGIAPEATNDMTVCKPKTRRSVRTGAKCTLYRAYAGPLPDPHMMASGEKLRDIHPQPGLCKMLHGVENLNLVDSKFGHVPFGCVLSYQCPPEISKDCIRHPDALMMIYYDK
ncbi:uncharacterized protein LOC127358995 [Scomber scombrus]|uniref:Uncharacterized protein LOC127358995 n=1 Tax=Scomber scombrus TaxID=13677 RepID=A0AAV1PTL4_SCOSC